MSGAQIENSVPTGSTQPTASTPLRPPPPPNHVDIPIITEPENIYPASLELGQVGGFSRRVDPLPAIRIENVEQAGIRLALLKSQINLLETPESFNYYIFVMVFCWFASQQSIAGLCAALVLILKERMSVQQHVQENTVRCIHQVNDLREKYQSDPAWPQYEQRAETIRQSVFTHGIDRTLLNGSL